MVVVQYNEIDPRDAIFGERQTTSRRLAVYPHHHTVAPSAVLRAYFVIPIAAPELESAFVVDIRIQSVTRKSLVPRSRKILSASEQRYLPVMSSEVPNNSES